MQLTTEAVLAPPVIVCPVVRTVEREITFVSDGDIDIVPKIRSATPVVPPACNVTVRETVSVLQIRISFIIVLVEAGTVYSVVVVVAVSAEWDSCFIVFAIYTLIQKRTSSLTEDRPPPPPVEAMVTDPAPCVIVTFEPATKDLYSNPEAPLLTPSI